MAAVLVVCAFLFLRGWYTEQKAARFEQLREHHERTGSPASAGARR